jgi:hypothetical protein
MIRERFRDRMREQLVRARQSAEARGVTLGGVTIATDRQSQAMVTGALLMMRSQGAPKAVQWKTKNGTFAPIGLSELELAAQAIFAHIEACFAREAELLAELDAAEDPRSVDIYSGWPR